MDRKLKLLYIVLYMVFQTLQYTAVFDFGIQKDGYFSIFIVLNICCFVAHKISECLHGLIILCSLRGQCFRIYFNRLIFCEDDRKCSVKIGEVCGSQPHKILYIVLKNKKKYI